MRISSMLKGAMEMLVAIAAVGLLVASAEAILTGKGASWRWRGLLVLASLSLALLSVAQYRRLRKDRLAYLPHLSHSIVSNRKVSLEGLLESLAGEKLNRLFLSFQAGLTPDFSRHSLVQLTVILRQEGERLVSKPHDFALMSAYFGETIRSAVGGEWAQRRIAGYQELAIKIGKGPSQHYLYPSSWVYWLATEQDALALEAVYDNEIEERDK